MPPRRSLPPLLPAGLQAIAASQRGLLTAAQLAAHGFDRNGRRRLAAAGRLHRIHHGVWSIHVNLDLAARVLAARFVDGAGVACLRTASDLRGLDVGPRDQRIHLCLPPAGKRRQLPGIARHWFALAPEDVTDVHGVPCTTVARLVVDACREWTRADVVSLVDAALRLGQFSAENLAEIAPRLPASRRPWLGLADGCAESPLETRFRLLLHDAGLVSAFVPQWEVRTGYRFIARIDFAAPALRLGVECDGRGPHEAPQALFRDRRRADDLAALGWRLLRVTWDDVVNDPADVLRRVRRALAA